LVRHFGGRAKTDRNCFTARQGKTLPLEAWANP